MTSRERVLAAIAHREPDRVPCNLRLTSDLLASIRRHIGTDDYAEHFGHDIRYVWLGLPPPPPGARREDWTPAPADADVAAVAGSARALQARGLAVCGGYCMGVFEQAKDWLGDEAALTAPHEDPAGFARLLDRITDWKCAVYGAYARAGVDIVWIGDDLGTQCSLVMSPAQYRAWYRPRHRRIVEHIRRLQPGQRIAFHCCGHVTPLIPDLIAIGIDILEAVQAEAMDIVYLKREFGRDICFWGGGCDTRRVLNRGTPAEVRDHVRRRIEIFAPGGGFVFAAIHNILPEVPPENIVAMFDALRC